MDPLSLDQRLARLSPGQRASLEQRLRARTQRGASDEPAIPRRASDDGAPLSYGQERFWLHQQFHPSSFANHEHQTFRLRGLLDVAALQRSLDALGARHDTLRTSFVAGAEMPVQVVLPPRPVELRVRDWPATGGAVADELARELAEDVRHPFDLTRDLLLRATLVRLGPDDHLLQFVLHHIAMDGWSLGVLFRDLSALYATDLAKQPSALPELPIAYADFVAWERERVAGGHLVGQLAYWREVLGGAPVLDLPTDRPRSSAPTFRGARRRAELDADLTARLRALGRQTGVTLYVTLLAAFQVLLQRYAGQDDLSVGTPAANRSRPETLGAIGYYANLLVLRGNLADDPTFRELLGRTREVTLGAFAHQDVPYGRLVEELQPAWDASRNPLFQVQLALQTIPRRALHLPPAAVTRVDVDPGLAKFDLSLYVGDETIDVDERGAAVAAGDAAGGSDTLTLALEYSLDLFLPATAERLLDQYQTLLRGVVDDCDRAISLLPILGPDERQQVLVAWNRTEVAYPRDDLIHQLFEAQVARTPGAVAGWDEATALTYRELDHRANRVRDRLRTLGVGSGAPVGLIVERSPDALAAILGILKAGAAYLPLDPADPAERLNFVVRDARPSVVIARGLPAGIEIGRDQSIVALDPLLAEDATEPADEAAALGTPDCAAYVLYTSGSTGRPKGVVGTHRGVVNRCAWMWRAFPFGPDEVDCQKTSLGFVDSVWELFGPLLAGVPTVILPDAIVRDPHRLVDSLGSHRVTRLVVVPSLLRAILDVEPGLAERLPRLRQWISSGEPLSRDLAERFHRAMPGCQLLNLYGSSEVAADVTCFDTAQLRPEHVHVPIGRPIANTRIYLLDPRGQPAAPGARGEIFVGGAGLAAGYLNRPELTAERFVPDPFSDEPNARLFRTGDHARFLPDGNLDYLGRLDHQVKIRGNRVELGEIEATLRACPGVGDAVVVARADVLDGPRLVAFVEPSTADAPTSDGLRQHLKQSLPSWMLPATIVVLGRLPLTATGKADRQALARLDLDRVQPGNRARTTVAPRDALERQLQSLWESLLPVRPIGVTDDFFDLGGHSLLAVRLVDRIEGLFQRRLPLATLLDAPTIERLAAALRTSAPTGASSLVPIQTVGTRPPLFLVHGIEGGILLFRGLAHRLDADQPVYALQAPELAGQPSRQMSVEEQATEYVEAIRAVQPAGPYYLGGYSAGGLWALEMAQQLRGAGQDVALLVLLDTRYPWAARRPTLWRRLQRDLILTLALEPRQRPAFALGRAAAVAREIARDAVAAVNRWLMPSPTHRTTRRIRLRHQRAARAYVPSPYAGPALFFRTAPDVRSTPWALVADPYTPWRHVFRANLEIVDVPGGHATMLREPHVRHVAEVLRPRLAPAAAGRSTG